MEDEELEYALREPVLGRKHAVVRVGEDSGLEDYGEVWIDWVSDEISV